MRGDDWPGDVLKALANQTTQAILSLLVVEPTYPRRIGDLLSLSETEVARRLRQLERLGIVESEWKHIGKNVKLYELTAHAFDLRFTPQGLQVSTEPSEGHKARAATLNPFAMELPEVESFVGRQPELKLLRDGPSVVVVEGLPGIGKTTLLAQFAALEGDDAPVFWHAFRGVESLAWLANRLAVFAAQHGHRELLDSVESGAELADQREAMLSLLADAGQIIVLDDVHRVDDEIVAGFLSDAVARCDGCKLVLGTREPFPYDPTLDHVASLRLEGLDDEAVGALLKARGFDVDAGVLDRVRDEVGGHPLALNLLLEVASDTEGGLEALLDRIPEEDLEAYLLQEVDAGISEDERRVLVHASLFRTSFTVDDLRAITRKDPLPGLLKLRRRLLVAGTGQALQLHEVVRNFFYNLLQDKASYHERVAEHYLRKGTIEGRLEALHHLLAANRRDKVLRLLEEDLDLRDFDVIDAGYQNLYLAMLELFDEDEVADERQWALIEDEKGDIRYHRGQFDQALAHYDAALSHFSKLDDAERLADLGWKRALVLERLDRHDDALQACRDGLDVAADDGLARERLDAVLERLGS